tara:strand:+ start:1743 stop:1928 length:186 start_codon:yes stop_codon:yes gene_type:complete
MTQTEKCIYKNLIKYLRKLLEDGTEESLSQYEESAELYDNKLKTRIALKISVNHDVIKGDD